MSQHCGRYIETEGASHEPSPSFLVHRLWTIHFFFLLFIAIGNSPIGSWNCFFFSFSLDPTHVDDEVDKETYFIFIRDALVQLTYLIWFSKSFTH